MGETVDLYVEADADQLPDDATVRYSLPNAAAPVGPFYVNSVFQGRDNLLSLVRNRIANCPGIRIGLAGYSQGAHVIHLALERLTEAERGVARGVLLLADPLSAGDTGYARARTARASQVPVPVAESSPGTCSQATSRGEPPISASAWTPCATTRARPLPSRRSRLTSTRCTRSAVASSPSGWRAPETHTHTPRRRGARPGGWLGWAAGRTDGSERLTGSVPTATDSPWWVMSRLGPARIW